MTQRLSVWERAGDAVNATSWQDAAQQSGLDFQVDKIPQRNELTGERSDKHFGLYRDDTFDLLSIVGAGYEVCQPATMFSFLDALGGEGAEYTRAGFFGSGEKIFVQMSLGEFDVLGSGDKHKKFLTGINSYDGSVSETYKTTDIRIVCRNTFDFVVKDKSGRWVKFRHTRNAAQRRADALLLLQSAQATAATLHERFELLAQRKVNSQIVGQSIAKLFNIDLAKELTPQNAQRVEVVHSLFESNDNDAFPEFRGTAYNLVNAFTEYADHFRDTRADGSTTAERQRAFSAIFGSGEELKAKAMEVVLELSNGAELTNQARSYSYTEKTGEKGASGDNSALLDSILDASNLE